MPEVPATPTPITPPAMAAVLVPAFAEQTGRLPSRLEAAGLLAHLWMENRRGEAVIAHNWGNLTTRANGGLYWRPPWWKVDESSSPRMLELHALMKKGQEPSAFRAFRTHEEGAKAYVHLLSGRYVEALEAADQGDWLEMSKALARGYCPACPVVPQAKTLQTFATQALKLPELSRLPRASGGKRSGRGGTIGAFAAVTVLTLAFGAATGTGLRRLMRPPRKKGGKK